MTQCTPTCPSDEVCGFDQFSQPKCYANCKDPTCGGHGVCEQVYGEQFLCVCDFDYTLQNETCTRKCDASCSVNKQKCGLDVDGQTAKCYNSQCDTCSAPGLCLQNNFNDQFVCKCPIGFKNEPRCSNCADGYSAYNRYCYKLNCGDNSCNGHGKCNKVDEAAHEYVCTCTEGYDPATFCATCLSDREPGTNCSCPYGQKSISVNDTFKCVINTCLASNGKECNDKGTCLVDTSAQTPVLTCKCPDNMLNADNCLSCAAGHYVHPISMECVPNKCLEDCNNGACRETSGGKNCVCNTGYNSLDYCKTCADGYTMKGGVCRANGSNTVLIVTVVVCVVVLVAAGGAGAWFLYNLRHKKQIEEELVIGQNLIEDDGQLGTATKGLQLQI